MLKRTGLQRCSHELEDGTWTLGGPGAGSDNAQRVHGVAREKKRSAAVSQIRQMSLKIRSAVQMSRS